MLATLHIFTAAYKIHTYLNYIYDYDLAHQYF